MISYHAQRKNAAIVLFILCSAASISFLWMAQAAAHIDEQVIAGTLSERFTIIYKENRWGSPESRSGPGSTLEMTKATRRGLQCILTEYKITSILDVACGDFLWMQSVPMPNIKYEGRDIVQEIIANNQKHHTSSDYGSRSFTVADVVSDPLSASDLIIARDVFIHLSESNVLRALRNIKASGSKYLFATTFPDAGGNTDIADGDLHAVDLSQAPYNLGAPEELIVEEEEVFFSNSRYTKAIGLWPISAIPD